MQQRFQREMTNERTRMKKDGVYKRMLYLEGPQSAVVPMEGYGDVIVLSSNNYLGLCDVPEIREAGKRAIDTFGAGTSSVRFICGTTTIHRELESKLAAFFGTDAAISYVSCWNANTGLMPTFFGPEDLVVSDELNHASIIDGVRMCKAKRAIYKHGNMAELESILKSHQDARYRFVITDGVFSMEGAIARLPDLRELCDRYDAILAVDDSHASGVLGQTGRGTAEHFGMHGKVDVLTSTLGKALGGAAGGWTGSTEAVVDMLVQRSRPQLFSNALPPTVAASSLAAVTYLETHPERVTKLRENTSYFRERVQEIGLDPIPGETPIVPIVLGETAKAIRMSELLLEEGVFVTGFGFPVVPQGQARIRCQISAAHEKEHLDRVVAAMKKAGGTLGLLGSKATGA